MHSILRDLVAYILIVGSVYWYAVTHFYRDPGSAFFDPNRAFIQRYSQHRLQEVDQYIRSFGNHAHDDTHLDVESVPELCIALSSVLRKNSSYTETTIGSLLQGLSPEERNSVHIELLIADTEPERHPAWDSAWIRATLDAVQTYNVTQETRAYLKHLQETDAYAEKGIFDYNYAMRSCFETGARYVAIFEDDILLADGWLIRALLALHRIAAEKSPHQWLFMRLFNQERSTGWAGRAVGQNHQILIILVIAILATGTAVVLRQRYHFVHKHLGWSTIISFIVLLNPALVVLFFQCGKASVLPPRPGVFREDFGCCSQALVFPKAQIPLVMEFLHQKQAGQIDLLLNEFARERGLARYALYPVQAQHLGLQSARGTNKAEAQAVWSMAYEDLNPSRLAREHREMIRQYFPES